MNSPWANALLAVALLHPCLGQYCDSSAPLVEDFDPVECPEGQVFMKDALDCFPGCVKVQNENEVCGDGKVCRPGLVCRDFFCQVDEKSCLRFGLAAGEGPKYMPDCLPDGSFAAKQCKGDRNSGRCFCSDRDGRRTFGHAWRSQADGMACGCSRRLADLQAAGRADASLHCDPTGSYEAVQCDSGLCWCAHNATGEPLYPAMPESLLQMLPCYDEGKVGSQYRRRCESQTLAQAEIRLKFRRHGTASVSFPPLRCDADGSYSHYVTDGSRVVCTWRDGSTLGSWASERGSRTPNCNCARDSRTFPEEGNSLLLACAGNGNYDTVQKTDDGQYFCVDNDGFPTTEMLETDPHCRPPEDPLDLFAAPQPETQSQ